MFFTKTAHFLPEMQKQSFFESLQVPGPLYDIFTFAGHQQITKMIICYQRAFRKSNYRLFQYLQLLLGKVRNVTDSAPNSWHERELTLNFLRKILCFGAVTSKMCPPQNAHLDQKKGKKTQLKCTPICEVEKLKNFAVVTTKNS